MADPRFEEKFIAFIDLLGFKEMVRKAENDEGKSLKQILDVMDCLNNTSNALSLREFGPTIFPDLPSNSPNLGFESTQVSDCVIISFEKSLSGAINIIHHCASIVFKLLSIGILVRGHILIGTIYHSNNCFLGSGYQNAYVREGKTTFMANEGAEGTPFVEVDADVIQYIKFEDNNGLDRFISATIASLNGAYAIYPFNNFLNMAGNSDDYSRSVDICVDAINIIIDEIADVTGDNLNSENKKNKKLTPNEKIMIYKDELQKTKKALLALRKQANSSYPAHNISSVFSRSDDI